MVLLDGTNLALPQFSAILVKFTCNDWKTKKIEFYYFADAICLLSYKVITTL